MKLPPAIILAGGLGTRLQQFVSDRPKVLAEAAGRPFIDYVLNYLEQQGVKQVILSVGFLAEQIIKYVDDGSQWNLTIQFSREESPLGTAGGLRLASQNFTGPFLALNGDTLFNIDLQSLVKTHLQLKALATIGLLHQPKSQARGCVELGEDGLILRFREKPVGTGPAVINGGVYVLDPQTLSNILPGQKVSLEHDIFPALAEEGRLAGIVQDSYFADIGTPESLLAFEKDAMSQKVKF